MSTTMAGHVLVIGVDGVRFDLLGPDTTPGIMTSPDTGWPSTPGIIADASTADVNPRWPPRGPPPPDRASARALRR